MGRTSSIILFIANCAFLCASLVYGDWAPNHLDAEAWIVYLALVTYIWSFIGIFFALRSLAECRLAGDLVFGIAGFTANQVAIATQLGDVVLSVFMFGYLRNIAACLCCLLLLGAGALAVPIRAGRSVLTVAVPSIGVLAMISGFAACVGFIRMR